MILKTATEKREPKEVLIYRSVRATGEPTGMASDASVIQVLIGTTIVVLFSMPHPAITEVC